MNDRELDYYLLPNAEGTDMPSPIGAAPQLSFEELMRQSYRLGNIPPIPQSTMPPMGSPPPPIERQQRIDPETMGLLQRNRQPGDIPLQQKIKEHMASSGSAWSNFFNSLGRRGRNFRGDTTAPFRAEADVRNQYLNEQRALEALRQSRQPKPALNPLQQFSLQDKIQQARIRNALNDPNSGQSKKARDSIAMLYPEFYQSVVDQGIDSMSANDINSEMFKKRINDYYQAEELQQKSDIQLERQKSFADYTADLEREKAALHGGLAGEARKLRGEERVARGGTEEISEGIRTIVMGFFPGGEKYFEDHPEFKPGVANIMESAFKRGSLNKQNYDSLRELAKRAEKDQAYVINGWKWVGKSELQPQEIVAAREAVSAWNQIQPAINRLKKLSNSLSADDLAAAKLGYLTQEMSDAIAIGEQLSNNLRIVGNYGVPQKAELERIEKQIPPLNTIYGIINGIRLAESMNKALTEKLKARMATNGWIRDTPVQRENVEARKVQ